MSEADPVSGNWSGQLPRHARLTIAAAATIDAKLAELAVHVGAIAAAIRVLVHVARSPLPVFAWMAVPLKARPLVLIALGLFAALLQAVARASRGPPRCSSRPASAAQSRRTRPRTMCSRSPEIEPVALAQMQVLIRVMFVPLEC